MTYQPLAGPYPKTTAYPLVRIVGRVREHPCARAMIETLACGHTFRDRHGVLAGAKGRSRRRCLRCPVGSPNWPVCP